MGARRKMKNHEFTTDRHGGTMHTRTMETPRRQHGNTMAMELQ